MAMRQAFRLAKPHHHIDISLFGCEELGVTRGEPKLTRQPRLCDLMSRKGLAYLFLAWEP